MYRDGFWERIILLAIAVGFALFFAVGFASYYPPFRYSEEAAVSLFQAPVVYYQRLASTYSVLPEVCWKEITIDDFQRKQCSDFWNTLVSRSVLATLPVIGMFLCLMWSSTSLFGFYATARKKARKGKPDVGGVLIHLSEPRGWLGWLYGFQAAMIELPDKKQVKVYLPADVPMPGIGNKLIAFNVSRGPWEKVYLAAAYTPHVAVVRGE